MERCRRLQLKGGFVALANAVEWPQAIIFDLDGTLLDSAPDIAQGLNKTFQQVGYAPFSLEDVRLMIGGGARKLIERALIARSLPSDKKQVDDLLALFLVHYEACCAEQTMVYPHAKEVITAIKRGGRKVGLCTNKPEAITHIALKAFDLFDLFDGIVGGREDFPRKPDPASLVYLLKEIGVQADASLMIGDSGADVGAARALDMGVYVMSYGYSKTPAKDLGADGVLHDLRDIETLLTGKGAA